MGYDDYLEFYGYDDDMDSMTDFERVIVDLELYDEEIQCFKSSGLNLHSVKNLLSETDDEGRILMYQSLSKNVMDSLPGSYYHRFLFSMTKVMEKYYPYIDISRYLFDLKLSGADTDYLKDHVYDNENWKKRFK